MANSEQTGSVEVPRRLLRRARVTADLALSMLPKLREDPEGLIPKTEKGLQEFRAEIQAALDGTGTGAPDKSAVPAGPFPAIAGS
jgi:hypothetical protein